MELRQLAALVALADHGTFTAAADSLHTVQSNVSTHVARLEREVGAVLFDRGNGRLTPEGEVVADRARRIQGELDGLVSDVAAFAHDVSGHVRIGIIATTARWLAPLLLNAMEEAHPRVRVVVVDASTTSLVPQVVSGRLDLAVINLPLDDPDLAVAELFSEDLLVVAPPGHPIGRLETVGLDELGDVALLLPPPGTALRQELDAAASAAGVVLQARAEVDGPHLLASLVHDGRGVGIVPATAVRDASGSGAAGRGSGAPWDRVVLRGLPRRHVGVAQRRRSMPAAPVRALQSVLAEVIALHADGEAGVHAAPRPATSG
ncbi:MAG: LysR family transcriptional regulator [Acidimicrobiales bacterium]